MALALTASQQAFDEMEANASKRRMHILGRILIKKRVLPFSI